MVMVPNRRTMQGTTYFVDNKKNGNIMSLVKKRRTENGSSSNALTSVGNGQQGRVLYENAIELSGHEGACLSAKFNNVVGDVIATAGKDKSILLWRLPTDPLDDSPNFGTLSGHKSAVTSVSWSSDNSVLASGSADATVRFWDAETGKIIRKCVGHELCTNEVSISKASDDLALSVADDGWACIWDKRDKYPTMEIQTEYPLLTGTFNTQGSTFYISGIEPIIRAYDIRETSKPLWECPSFPANESITSIAINNDDSILLSRSMNGHVNTYSAKEFVPEGISRSNNYSYNGAPSGTEQQVIRACFSNDSVSIVSGSEDKTVTCWDLISRKIQNKLEGHRSTVLGVDFHPTERIIASTSVDGTVIVREI